MRRLATTLVALLMLVSGCIVDDGPGDTETGEPDGASDAPGGAGASSASVSVNIEHDLSEGDASFTFDVPVGVGEVHREVRFQAAEGSPACNADGATIDLTSPSGEVFTVEGGTSLTTGDTACGQTIEGNSSMEAGTWSVDVTTGGPTDQAVAVIIVQG